MNTSIHQQKIHLYFIQILQTFESQKIEGLTMLQNYYSDI